jgi:hypothetical protein
MQYQNNKIYFTKHRQQQQHNNNIITPSISTTRFVLEASVMKHIDFLPTQDVDFYTSKR